MSRNKKISRPVTAAALMAKLSQDAEFTRRRNERSEIVEAIEEESALEERPLVLSLSEAGVPVKSVWDLVNTEKSYPQAIPVLVFHLRQPYSFRLREGIVRALTVDHAGEAAYAALVSEYKKLPNSTEGAQHNLKWALGNAISIVANKGQFDEITELVRDKRHGTARDMMTQRLPSLDRKRAVAVLVELLADDEVCGYALRALRKVKSRIGRDLVEHVLIHHPQPWVREEAKKTLAELKK